MKQTMLVVHCRFQQMGNEADDDVKMMKTQQGLRGDRQSEA